ncbi:hypothetical protein [Variovorax terrae]|uniref:Uncharacterized protein n=1 Tax=Variovorax terrae TaxID=2923278 RepID=A0A9X1VUC0_9BURK|nr:hypothetical protein [Variovorax terrae]MCJ0763467.1 hypothetical protein [Variovorax terrae]
MMIDRTAATLFAAVLVLPAVASGQAASSSAASSSASSSSSSSVSTSGGASSSVVTGGHWSSEGRTGSYRVVVAQGGAAPAAAHVRVEWLAEANPPGRGAEVVAAVEPRLPFGQEGARLGVELQSMGPGQARITLTGPAPAARAVFIATTPGHLAAADGAS